MRQEATLAIKWTAVIMETLSKEDHDVCKVLHFVTNVAVGDFPEMEGGDTLPDCEGLPDGLIGLVFTHLGGIVLYTEELCECVKEKCVKGMTELKIIRSSCG